MNTLQPKAIPKPPAIGNLPPQDTELEQVVLGAIMLEKGAFLEVADILKPQVFYKQKHQAIFEACLSLFRQNEPIDLMTVTHQLKEQGKLEMVGGPLTIAQLTQKVNSAANIVSHARILQQYYIKRELITKAQNMLKEAYSNESDCFELMDSTVQSVFELQQGLESRGFVSASDMYAPTMSEIEQAGKNTNGMTGISTPFTELNKVFGGWQKGDFYLLGARPAMGKTSMAVQLALHPAIAENKAVGIVELEMTNRQLMKRAFSLMSGIHNEKIKKGSLTSEEWERLLHTTNPLHTAPLFMDDTPAQTSMQLRAKARRLKTQHDIQLLVIDYIQLMKDESRHGRNGNREQEISQISQACKRLAKELDIPVIALAQLSRAVEMRGGDKRPLLSDLRDSGSLEQDSDSVFFLYRPEYYGIEELEDGTSSKGYAEVVIRKHRHGEIKNVPLKWEGHLTRFSDWHEADFQPVFNETPSRPNVL